MASSTTPKRRMAPRPATDPKRWSKVSGGRNIRRQPQPSGLQKALGMLPFGKKAAPAKSGGRGGKAGTAAMLTAAAGFAYKNRGQIAALLNKRRGGQRPQP
jgi:hypothetical protein